MAESVLSSRLKLEASWEENATASASTPSSDSPVNANTEFLTVSWFDGKNVHIVNAPRKNFRRDIINSVIQEVKMQPYDGEPVKWHDFISNFEKHVHKSLSMTNSQKHALLKQLLTPTVRCCIDDYSAYDQALEALKERYGNPNIIARAHAQAILNIKKVEQGDVAALEKLWKTLAEALNFYKINGFESEINSFDNLLFASSKLPSKHASALLQESYRHCCVSRRLNLEDFVKWLEECVLMEKLMRDMKIEKQQTANPRGNSRKRN